MLTFAVTHKHPTLGKLDIRFSINDKGAFALESIDMRYRRVAYANWHHYRLFFWHDQLGNCWGLNYWQSRWANGTPAHFGTEPRDIMNDFLPELLAFINSPAFAAVVRAKLKRSMKQMRLALLSIAAPELEEVQS